MKPAALGLYITFRPLHARGPAYFLVSFTRALEFGLPLKLLKVQMQRFSVPAKKIAATRPKIFL
jgi:hypothetical protein